MLFGDNPDKVSKTVDSIATGNLESAIDIKLTKRVKNTTKTSSSKSKKVAKAKKGRKSSGKSRKKKGSFDYTSNLFAKNTNPKTISKNLRKILEEAQKA